MTNLILVGQGKRIIERLTQLKSLKRKRSDWCGKTALKELSAKMRLQRYV